MYWSQEGGAGVSQGQEHSSGLQNIYHYRLTVPQPVRGNLSLDEVQETKLKQQHTHRGEWRWEGGGSGGGRREDRGGERKGVT